MISRTVQKVVCFLRINVIFYKRKIAPEKLEKLFTSNINILCDCKRIIMCMGMFNDDDDVFSNKRPIVASLISEAECLTVS